jgi:Fe-S-cluster-containing hydrogenase component 2
MKRQIIHIDEDKCNGCGLCASGCPEGAIQMVGGKARLVGELLCDGLGACIGSCPAGAITIEEREAEPYNERKVMENIIAKGPDVIKAHLRHLADHGQTEYLEEAKRVLKQQKVEVKVENEGEGHHNGGCPGSMMKSFKTEEHKGGKRPHGPAPSELGQWPVQLKLLNPAAPYFRNADLLIAADCVPFAFGDFHSRFLKGKALVVFCPKLDQAYEDYVEKLAELFRINDIKSVSVVRMEVPCCGGTTAIVEEAIKRSGKRHIIKEYTVGLEGEII